MKNTPHPRNRSLSIGLIVSAMSLMFTLINCSSDSGQSGYKAKQPVLFGANHYSANPSHTSNLYNINLSNGTATTLGDIGFPVDGMAYDPSTEKMYGITEGANSQLIEINTESGHGTLIADITAPGSSVTVDNGFNNDYIYTIGADGSDYYAQSFIAQVSAINRFGVVIKSVYSTGGQVRLAIVADNGGKPDVSAPLYQGTLISPTTTESWYYVSNIDVPVTIGQKYYVLVDGYDIPGTTGASYIGKSDHFPISGEGMTWSNNGGSNWTTGFGPIAIRIEGTPYFSHPTFNSKGELIAWNNSSNAPCSINKTTGVATCSASTGLNASDFGFAFNKQAAPGAGLSGDVLYLINGEGSVYTVDQTTGAATSVGSITGLPNNMAHRGDLQAGKGIYWGLDNTDAHTNTRNLLLIDMSTLTVKQTIPTVNNLHALAFGCK